MSLHKSLRRRNSLQRRRNVLTRTERIDQLEGQERWSEDGDSVFGLPKVKPISTGAPAKRAKAAQESEADEEAGAAEEAE